MHCRRQKDVSVSDTAVVALKINWTGKFFVAVECTAGNAGNFLVRNDGVAVLDDSDETADKCNIECLPDAGASRLFRIGCKETINRTHVMIGRFFN